MMAPAGPFSAASPVAPAGMGRGDAASMGGAARGEAPAGEAHYRVGLDFSVGIGGYASLAEAYRHANGLVSFAGAGAGGYPNQQPQHHHQHDGRLMVQPPRSGLLPSSQQHQANRERHQATALHAGSATGALEPMGAKAPRSLDHQPVLPHLQPPGGGQFGILTPPPPGAASRDNTGIGVSDSDLLDSLAPYKLGDKDPVVDPPGLQAWRERLFHVDDMIVLTHEEYETYFPHVDNVYSHRSTQRYKRKPFISHYWDCRMKGRPPGTPKSDDPSKKKRKRNARERDLCDVKIKITEYLPNACAAAALDSEVAAAIAAGESANLAGLGAGQRFWTIQRVNGNGGNGKGDGVAGPHKHTLAKSDEIKKNSVQRLVAQMEKGTKLKVTTKKPTGTAALTMKRHSKDSDLKFYGACSCPFSQRVWIALEAKHLAYQYIETDPSKQIPSSPHLLEVPGRGKVPAIRHGEWACTESGIILEYLEDLYPAISLWPNDPRLKANCRLWIDQINTCIIPTYFSLLHSLRSSPFSLTPATPQTPSHPPTQHALSGRRPETLTHLLQSHLTNLLLAADEQGPFFLGHSLSLVDIHFAPFAFRIRRLVRDGIDQSSWTLDPVPAARWLRWLSALERDQHVCATMSLEEVYVEGEGLMMKLWMRDHGGGGAV